MTKSEYQELVEFLSVKFQRIEERLTRVEVTQEAMRHDIQGLGEGIQAVDEKLTRRMDALDARVGRLESRMDANFARVDLRFEAVDRRFDEIDLRFEAVDRRFDEIDLRFDGVDRQFGTTNGHIHRLSRILGGNWEN